MLKTAYWAVRTGIGMLILALVTLFIGGYLTVLARLRPRSRQIAPLMRLWGRAFLAVAGARVTVEGLDHIDPSTSYVFVSNHLSNLDPPLHISRLPVRLSFLAKQELFKIPVLAQAMRAVGMVETDRQAAASGRRKINEQVRYAVDLGLSLIIYPEGTRSKTGDLKPFKKGAFRIAADNDLPIVPIAIAGTHGAWGPGAKSFRGGRVRMVVHPPIPTAGVKPSGVDGLRVQAHDAISATFDRLTSDD